MPHGWLLILTGGALLAAATGGSIDLAYTPPGAIPTDGSRAVCNNYIPSTTILARFLWVVAVLARNSFVVVIGKEFADDLVNAVTLCCIVRHDPCN